MAETFQSNMSEYRGDLDQQIIVMKNTLVDLTDNKVNVGHFRDVTRER